ncbi:MAG: DUF5069 domain-containing protein [Luteolibacter sp.]|uniref:DUF5069 domain-containing protein n=1 Tax=Luteolibacter sp. TaxID=1962973 RepID=UPI0032638955
MNYSAPDLAAYPPRSPRAQLGGYAILPRMLDKCRATLAGKKGEYHYACPTDQRFFQFTGIDPETLKAEIAKGLSDTEALAWITANAPNQHMGWEIALWTASVNQAVPSDNEWRAFFNELVTAAKIAHRADIQTWFEYIEADDYVSFGGRP